MRLAEKYGKLFKVTLGSDLYVIMSDPVDVEVCYFLITFFFFFLGRGTSKILRRMSVLFAYTKSVISTFQL